MRKKYVVIVKCMMTIFLLFIGNTILWAQDFEIQKDAYNKTPNGNIANGLPQIGFPLLNVPTSSSKLSFNVSIDYNANGTSNQNLVGDAGKGWNLSSDYSVVRISHAYPVDYSLITNGALFTNVSSGNVFQYNIPGESSKFTVNYDKTTNKYVGISENGFKNKILIEKNTTDTLIYKIKSFTVIDSKGLKYIFDKPDISYYRGINDNIFVQKNFVELYHSAFHITKILDDKNNILANFDYTTTEETVNDSRGSYLTTKSKISKIQIPNIGSVSFIYLGGVSDLQIILKDISDNIVKQVLLNRDGGNYLNSFTILDKNNIKQETYSFEYNDSSDNIIYDQFGFPNNLSYCSIEDNERFFSPISPNPKFSTLGLLKTIYLPTGGHTEYEYESNTINPSNAIPALPNYFDSYKTDIIYDEDFQKQQLDPPLIVNVDPTKYSKFFVMADGITYYKNTDQIDHLGISYTVNKMNDNSILDNIFTYYEYQTGLWKPCDWLRWFGTSDFSVRFRIIGKSSGHIKIYGIRNTPEPFIYTEGVRIKNIKKYEGNNPIPSESLLYDYNYFDNPQVPSSEDYGMITYPHPTGLEKILRQLIYKNVKVTDVVKNFTTRYTFLLPSEVASQVNQSMTTMLDYGSSYSTGLPVKIAQYTGSNQLVSEKNYQYTFGSKQISNQYLVPADFKYPLLQKLATVEKSYRENNSILTTTTEKIYEPLFNNIISEKSTDFSGETVETTYKYAAEMQNQNLLSANKVATPIVTEIKSTRNGILTPLSKTENQYNTANSSEPTDIISYDPVSGTPSTEATINKYDMYGNVIQTTGKDGISNCIIYGYHGTLPIARISGITYDALQNQGLLSAIIAASDADADNPANESQLLNALTIFRRSEALKSLPVITFTYDPLIGVTSETDASGIKKVYQYDNANKLIKILDASGNTLQEFKTHFKIQ